MVPGRWLRELNENVRMYVLKFVPDSKGLANDFKGVEAQIPSPRVHNS